MNLPLDRRPVLVTLAGPNGAGKSTFYHTHLKAAGLRLVNADILAKELKTDAYAASRLAGALRLELLNQKESFVFETVFSDPAGSKLAFLRQAETMGYNVILCFIGLERSEISETRVAMRVSQGGHDVPQEKLISRFPRTLANLQAALQSLKCVYIFDNSDLRRPFALAAAFVEGKMTFVQTAPPKWLSDLINPLLG